VTPAEATAPVGGSVTFQGRVVGVLPSGATTIGVRWSVRGDAGVASIMSSDADAGTITVTCDAPGVALIWLDLTGYALGDNSPSSLRCTAAPTSTTPPSNAPVTPESLVGTWVKQGTRTPGSNCNPSAFGASFTADLVIERNSAGNLGIRFLEGHGDGTVFPYSQFTATAIADGITIVSGNPMRSIGGRPVETHIELTFVNGQARGKETFTFPGPPPCTDEYTIEAVRR
jgi:hypothetical protein